MSDDGGRVGRENYAVPLLNDDRLVAVKARGLDVYRLARDQPANCQRLKASLGEPLLLSVYGDAMVGWDVGEGWEGSDPVGIRVQPRRVVCGHQVV